MSPALKVNIDDCWQVARYGNKTIVADPVRFPSGIQQLSRDVQNLGMKFGLYVIMHHVCACVSTDRLHRYTARGTGTCQGRPGSRYYETIDATTYCNWGIDYIKVLLISWLNS